MTEKRFWVEEDDECMVREERYYKNKKYLHNDEVHDRACHRNLNTDEVVELLNRLEDNRRDLKKLNIEYKRTSNILNDFMSVLNKLQANPTDDSLIIISRDMLKMMAVDLL